MRSLRYWLNDVVDVVDRVRNASVLSYALVSEVDLTVCVNCNVLEESVAADSLVDIWLRNRVKVDNLSVATTLVVEYTLVIPTVLVVTDEETLRVS